MFGASKKDNVLDNFDRLKLFDQTLFLSLSFFLSFFVYK